MWKTFSVYLTSSMQMRKLLSIIFFVVCSLSYSRAQYIWVSQDNNSHYVDIEYGANVNDPIVLNSAHQPALSYVTMLVDMYRDKIKSGEWSVWIESYVHDQNNAVDENRKRAKTLSNTIKSYFIANKILVEDDFTTRNYSGTLSRREGITTIIVGQRYPLERILPEQLIDWEYNDLVWLTDMAKDDSLVTVNFEELSTLVPGMDTTKIYSPYFEPITFSYKALPGAPKSDTVALDKTKDLRLVPSTMEQPSNAAELDRKDAVAVGVMPVVAVEPKGRGKKEGRKSRVKDQSVAQATVKVKPEKVRRRGSGAEAIAGVSGVAVGAASATTGGSQFKNIEIISLNEQVAKAQLGDLRYRNSNAGTQSQSSGGAVGSKMIEIKGGGASKEKASGIEYPLSLNIPSLAAATPLAASAAVGATVNQSASFYDNKGRLVRPKKSGTTPKMVYDDKGNPKLDATAFERALSVENLAVIEAENRSIRVAEERAVRARHATGRRQELREVQQAKGRFAVFGVGLNALTTLALIPSIQFDAYFSNRFQASVEWYYSRWNYDEAYKLNMNMLSPELRFYPMGKIKQFSGLYVGIYGALGAYNYRWNSNQGRQSDYWSVGISAGYVLPLGKRGFYLEAGLSAGYLNEQVDSYLCHHGENFRTESYRQITPFFPTKIKVSFVYRIFNQKTDRGE